MKSRNRKGSSKAGPILFGIIGTGEIVEMIQPTLQSCHGLRVIALAGTNTSAANSLAKKFDGATVYPDYKVLLGVREIEAVYIATPPHLHTGMLKAVLEAGKHVVCEKPLVMNLGELHGVLAAHKRHAFLKVASCSSRFNICPPVRRARDLIAQGRLGKILRVRLNNSVALPLPISSLAAWKRSRVTSGGGLCMDWGVYDLDWLRFLLGELFDPVALMGSIDHSFNHETDLETGYAAHILCRNGLTISLERRPEHGPRFQRAEIRGTEGGLDLPFMPGSDQEALTVYRHDQAKKKTFRIDTLPVRMNDWGTILAYPIIDLAQAIVEKREVASPLSIQNRIYAVIAALYRSSAAGKSVAVV
jgi:predicted dehydrogenase